MLGRAGLTGRLRPDRTLHLPASATLLVADVHLGKAETFASLGVPVPAGEAGPTHRTLARLAQALASTRADRLIVLGDWWHGPRALGPAVEQAVDAWRRQHRALTVVLVEGNHDRRAVGRSGTSPTDRRPPSAAAGDRHVAPGWPGHGLDGLRLAHDPSEPSDDDRFELAGHLHPCVTLRGRGRDAARLPCFWWRPHGLVLPAFGDFTGGHAIRPAAADRVYVVDGERVTAIDT